MDDFEKELKLGFLEEAAQAIADVEQCFLALESDPENIENLNKIFRLAHNLKGSSKAVGFDEFGQFTHEFETFILRIKNGELKANSHAVNLLLRANDHVLMMVESLKSDLNAQFDSVELLEKMISFSQSESDSDSDSDLNVEETVEVEESIEASVLNMGPEVIEEKPLMPLDIRNDPTIEELLAEDAAKQLALEKNNKQSATAAPILKVVSNEASVSPVHNSSPPRGSGSNHSSSQAVDEYIRVALSKVENLINFVGEMVILQSVLEEQSHTSANPLIRKTVHQLGKVGKEIQELSMGLRMVPIKPTFQKMVRIVRDTAQALSKDVSIHLVGEDTEIDKTVLEKLNDPLVHLIRNSVDHGIENVEIRKKSGKSEKGHVTLSAFHQSGKLVIQVIDDGGGLNPQKLIAKAIEKGILKNGVQLTDKEAYQLIFAPGFSTKEKVTDVSGRGVGMDVVKTNITDLGGEIRIESAIDKGTTITIILPLTLAIIESMVVTYSSQKFIIPLSQVYETLNPKINMVQETHDLGSILMLRGENIPLVRLGDFFDIKSQNPLHSMIAMVIRTSAEPFALVVDDILGQFQVVTKPLGTDLADTKGVSGTTILGDGKPALILECNDLLKRKLKNNYTPAKTGQKEKVA